MDRSEKAFGGNKLGNKPYDWQVDVTEVLLLGLDCIVIVAAGIGVLDMRV